MINETFIIGKNKFEPLEINSAPHLVNFYYFYNKETCNLIKQFILKEGDFVDYICFVTLIKKGDKFTPRLRFSIRDKTGKIQNVSGPHSSQDIADTLKANIDLDGCYENFWKLISFLQSLREIDVPKEAFSLSSQSDADIVSALRGHKTKNILNIIKQVLAYEDISLSEQDINQLLKRKQKLLDFRKSLNLHESSEELWQNFFQNNKWIFGYGLNYQILRQEQVQPNYGGTRIDGKGGQRGDYLTSTMGDINFTVLVEIKTPQTPLLQGITEIRNGAWSLSKNLTDAISQISANIDMWEKQGSTIPENIDTFEKKNTYTVQPRGIIVIGSLSELDNRSKRETFQRFRKSVHGIDILTFDELLERATYIVDEKQEKDMDDKNPELTESEEIPLW